MRRSLVIILIAILAGIGGLVGVGFLVYQLFIAHPFAAPSTVPTSGASAAPDVVPVSIPEPAAATSAPEALVYTGPREHTIHITRSGTYEPHDITLFVGDTLTFINDDHDAHWPGANPYPTHSSLPAFSAFGGIAHGERYSYLFMRSGVFGYHEHMNDASLTVGRITVLSQ